MHVQVTLQEAEITKGFQRIYAQAGIRTTRGRLALLALVVTVFIASAITAVLQKQAFYPTFIATSEQSGCVAVFGFVYFFIYAFLSRYAPKQQYYRADGLLRSPRTILIKDDGIHQTCPVSNSLTKWAGVMKIEEDAEFVFFYVDVISCYLIPKRCFPDAAKASAFAVQAKAYWSAAKKAQGDGLQTPSPSGKHPDTPDANPPPEGLKTAPA